ncbi:MAG: hypothetical protein NT056_01430 [Proteobacteria bacterium]|nr:hypothetical protein [Pseudomonadota bacterium]
MKTTPKFPWFPAALLFAVSCSGTGGNPPENQPRILSVFFGLDNALPAAAGFLCPGAAGQDGMPVVFSRRIDPASIDPGDFRIVTAGGAARVPVCATPAPATKAHERRTILLIGEFGDDPGDPPARLEITGPLLTAPGAGGEAFDFDGSAFTGITPLSAGPFLVWAEVLASGGDCPGAPTATVVQVTWAGGVLALSGQELGDPERERYRVTVLNATGAEETLVPFALGDLSDQDNHHELCLGAGVIPLRVEMAADTVIDPRGDPNPDTSVEITSDESP